MSKSEQAVLAALSGRQQFQSAQEIHAHLRGAGSAIGLTSVYRAVQRLRDSGQLDELRRHNAEAAYRRCRREHHHHLTCEGCGVSVELLASATERWIERVAGENGFVPTGHTIEIAGLCERCQT
ncbi:MAG: Fur family transcriptional regulator [Mycobacteriales bacterium]